MIKHQFEFGIDEIEGKAQMNFSKTNLIPIDNEADFILGCTEKTGKIKRKNKKKINMWQNKFILYDFLNVFLREEYDLQ